MIRVWLNPSAEHMHDTINIHTRTPVGMHVCMHAHKHIHTIDHNTWPVDRNLQCWKKADMLQCRGMTGWLDGRQYDGWKPPRSAGKEPPLTWPGRGRTTCTGWVVWSWPGLTALQADGAYNRNTSRCNTVVQQAHTTHHAATLWYNRHTPHTTLQLCGTTGTHHTPRCNTDIEVTSVEVSARIVQLSNSLFILFPTE